MRFLTPSKIGLVILVQLYCDQQVPDASLIPVLSFVLSHVLPNSINDHGSSKDESNTTRGVLSIKAFEAAVRSHQSAQPGRNLYDLFVKALWSIDSLHVLHEFFGRLEEYLAPLERRQDFGTPNRVFLGRTAPLGVFFRRVSLEFTRLQFDDAASLWATLAKFRAPSEAAWRRRNPAAIGPSFDLAISEFDVVQPNRLALAAYGVIDANGLEESGPSSYDVDNLLEFDLSKLQQFGSRVPREVQDNIKDMISANSKTPNTAYFASYFDAWRAGDFTGAFEYLHRYFDYTVRNRDKTFYQYALLHMAILHADFGCFDEAIASMNETIATARENQDIVCLNFSLSWLSHFSKVHPKQLNKSGYAGMFGAEKDRLGFLADKAKETKSWPVLSSTLLSEAKWALSLGADPATVSEHLIQSSHLNFAHHIFSNCSTQLLVESAMYARIGLNVLSDNDCEVLLHCYSSYSPTEDVVRTMCLRAQFLARIGQYARASAILESFEEETLRTLKLKRFIITHSGLTKLMQTLRKYDLVAAEHMLYQVQGSAPSDPDTSFQILLLELQYLAQHKNYATAFEKLEAKLQEFAKQQTDVVQNIKLLLVKAALYSETGNAGRGFTIVLRAASMCYKHKLMPLMWEAMGHLTNILNCFEEFECASQVMDAVLPQVLGSGDIALAAVLYGRQADACMGLAGREDYSLSQQKRLTSKTEEYVDRALRLYEKVQDLRGQCEMLSKKAIIARLRGDRNLAEDYATRYLALHDQQFCRKDGDIA